MATRHEKVVLSLEDNFTTGMARAAAAAAVLDRTLDKLDGNNVRTSTNLQRTSRDVDGLGGSLRRTSPEIDRFSGRLRLMTDAASILGPSLAPIGAVAVPALTGLASQAGFAVLGLGTLVAASQGVGDALTALNDAALEPTTANLEKAGEAMSKLGPDAATFVAEFQRIRPALTEIRDSAAAGWFPGLTEALGSLEAAAPRVADLFEAIGRTGGNLVAEGAAALAGPEWEEFIAFIGTEGPQALDDLGRTVGNLTRGMAELWMAFAPVNRSFSSWMLDASRGFAAWSEGLSATTGFQDFLSYIRENGPRVADALGALGEAVLQIVQAVAPLGGPSLQIIESFAKVVGALADSDLGTPILAAVAAYAALNRVMQVTVALQTRMSGTSALGGVLGGKGVTSLNRDLRTTMVNAGKAGAAIGGLTLATSGIADGFALSNTASLALMGTIAGPWGAAIGGGAGALLDMKGALEQTTTSAESFNAALASGSAETMRTEIKAIQKDLDDWRNSGGVGDTLSDVFQDITGGGFQSRGLDMQARASSLEIAARSAERASEAEAGLSDALVRTGREAGFTVSELLALADSTTQATAAAWGAFDAQTRLGAAIDGVATAAGKGKRGLDASTDAGRENREALSSLAGSWSETKAKMEENGASAKRIQSRYREVRGAFIAAATAMTGSREAAVRLANQLDKPMKIVIKSEHQAAVSSAKAAMSQLRREIAGNPIVQRVVVQTSRGPVSAKVGTQSGGLEELLGGRAYGGYTGPGGKYEPAGIVHRGEVVIPQDLVARDRDMLRSRYGQLPGMDQLFTGGLAGFANGGRVGRGGDDDLPRSLKGLTRALNASEKALDRERQQRDAVTDKMTSLSSTVTGNLRSDLFSGQGNPWSSTSMGGSLSDVLAKLNADIATGSGLARNISSLKSKGLDGKALDDLLANATPDQVAMFAGQSKGQIAEYERLYKVRESVSARVGASAGTAAYGKELAVQTRELKVATAELKEIRTAIRQEHRQDRQASKRGAGNASRNRKKATS